MRCLDFVRTAHRIYGYGVSRVRYNSPCLESWDHTTTFTACRAMTYLEGPGVCATAPPAGCSRRRGVPAQAPQHYLEIMELECDWLEEVVVALSCEKPL